MTAPIYAAALVVSVCVGYSSDHFNEKPFHVLGATIIAGISFIITATVPNAAVKYTFILFVSLHLERNASFEFRPSSFSSLTPLFSPSLFSSTGRMWYLECRSSLSLVLPRQLQEQREASCESKPPLPFRSSSSSSDLELTLPRHSFVQRWPSLSSTDLETLPRSTELVSPHLSPRLSSSVSRPLRRVVLTLLFPLLLFLDIWPATSAPKYALGFGCTTAC